MIKKYSPIAIFITIEIITVVLSLTNTTKSSPTITSLLIFFFIFVNPAIYYFWFLKKNKNFTFWFVIYSVFKVSPFLFKQKNTWFETLFIWKKYINAVLLLVLLWKAFFFIKKFLNHLKTESKKRDDDHTFLSEYLQVSIRFKKLSKMISFEVCAFYYALFKWKNKRTSDNFFTFYKNSGTISIYYGFILVSGAEAIGIHVMLYHKSKILSLLFIYLHIYILISIIGQIKAMLLRRHIIYEDKIVLCYGLFEAIEIKKNNIKSISKFEDDYVREKKLLKVALLGKMESHNVLIELESEITVHLPFGFVKSPKKILFYVDNIDVFINNIDIKNNLPLDSTSVSFVNTN